MKQINLRKLVSDMRAQADMFPANPLHNLARGEDYARQQLQKYQHRVKIDGYVVIVSFTRDRMPEFECREFYHLSLGNDQGKPELIPKKIVWRISSSVHAAWHPGSKSDGKYGSVHRSMSFE